ncbi:MAG: cell wall hydrolase [Sphingomonas sp.]|nr:cell wall hydrolase [Sphingomonas sp.]
MPWAGHPRSSVTQPVPPPAPVPTGDVATLLTNTPLAIAPADAVMLNAARPNDRAVHDRARPFILPAAATVPLGSSDAALTCMTQAIYYEAAVESDTGKRAVAQVVLNRMRSPIFPHTVCGVVFQGSEQRTGCQFSFTCDGSLARKPSLAGWIAARRIASDALAGRVERSIGLATHYHANYVVPYWAGSLDKVATIGAHIFYTMRGPLGRPLAFGAPYDAMAEASVTPAAGDSAADAAAALALTGATPAPAVVARPINRTTVRDDALGTAIHPTQALTAPPVSVLRADETGGKLMADQTKGTLGAAKPAINPK